MDIRIEERPTIGAEPGGETLPNLELHPFRDVAELDLGAQADGHHLEELGIARRVDDQPVVGLWCGARHGQNGREQEGYTECQP